MDSILNLDTLISNDRLANIIKYADLARPLEGNYAEVGVFRGGSLELISKLNPDKEVYAFDSFTGLPRPTDHDNYHQEGDFKDTNFEFLEGYFERFHHNVTFFKGFVPHTFSMVDPFKMYSFVHIDVDLYQSVKDSLDYFFPRMVMGGIIILDDYGFESTKGAVVAVDEFVSSITPAFKGELFYYPGGPSHKQYLIVK